MFNIAELNRVSPKHRFFSWGENKLTFSLEQSKQVTTTCLKQFWSRVTEIMFITLFLYEVRACTVKNLQVINFPSQKLNKGRTSDQQGETSIAMS